MKENIKKVLAALNVTALILGGSLPVIAGDQPQGVSVPKAEIVQPAQKMPVNGALQDLDNKEALKNRIPKVREKVGSGFCGAGKCGGDAKKADIPLPAPAKK